MKKQISTYVLCALLGLSTTACTTQTRVVSRAESQELVTATLSDNDFESAAKEMLDDMLANELSEPKAGGKPYVMMISDIQNDTMQRINTADLTDINVIKLLAKDIIDDNWMELNYLYNKALVENNFDMVKMLKEYIILVI